MAKPHQQQPEPEPIMEQPPHQEMFDLGDDGVMRTISRSPYQGSIEKLLRGPQNNTSWAYKEPHGDHPSNHKGDIRDLLVKSGLEHNNGLPAYKWTISPQAGIDEAEEGLGQQPHGAGHPPAQQGSFGRRHGKHKEQKPKSHKYHPHKLSPFKGI